MSSNIFDIGKAAISIVNNFVLHRGYVMSTQSNFPKQIDLIIEKTYMEVW